MSIFQLFIHDQIHDVIFLKLGFQGQELQYFDHLYLEKKKYFETYYRGENAKNDVLNNILPTEFR